MFMHTRKMNGRRRVGSFVLKRRKTRKVKQCIMNGSGHEASTKIILLKLLNAKPKCARDAEEHGGSDASIVHDCLHG